MNSWTCEGSARSGSRNAWTRIKTINGASRLTKIWNFFGAIEMFSCPDWWPSTKPGYIIMTRRQSNNQWSGGISAHPASPQKTTSANIRWKYSSLEFLGSRRNTSHWLTWPTKILFRKEKCLFLMYFWTLNSDIFLEFLYHTKISL